MQDIKIYQRELGKVEEENLVWEPIDINGNFERWETIGETSFFELWIQSGDAYIDRSNTVPPGEEGNSDRSSFIDSIVGADVSDIMDSTVELEADTTYRLRGWYSGQFFIEYGPSQTDLFNETGEGWEQFEFEFTTTEVGVLTFGYITTEGEGDAYADLVVLERLVTETILVDPTDEERQAARWDIDISNGDIQLISGSEETAQNVQINIRFVRGEYDYDREKGVPWDDGMLGLSLIQVEEEYEVRKAIVNVQGVSRVNQLIFSVDRDKRTQYVEYSIETLYGTSRGSIPLDLENII